MELVIGTVLIVLLAGAAWPYLRPWIKSHQNERLGRARKTATQAKVIHGWLMAYANDHGGVFPTGTNANAAYRELFKINAGASEDVFYIDGDPYHNSARDGRPDGNVGREPDYLQALEPGENAFAYVSGLTASDPARLPLIANGFSAHPGIWTSKDDEKGGMFLGKYGVVCRVGGSAVAHELTDGEWMVKEKYNGQRVNIFTSGFDDANFKVVNPQ